jgi:hypothetical protein
MADMPPVDDQTTFVDMNTVTSLCTTQVATEIMTGIFTRLLQQHFSDPANLSYNQNTEPGQKMLEDYIWTSDNTTTKIQIQPVWKYNPQDVQRRPALYVKRNKWETKRIAMNDGMTIGPSNGQVKGEFHVRQIDGSHTVFCVGRTGAEAELLGQEVTDLLMCFAPLLREDLKLHRLEVPEVDSVALVDEDVERYVVPVTATYTAMKTWRIDKVAPWLKTIGIQITP